MLFTYCISRINNKQVDNVHDNDVVISMNNLIEYGENYSKTFGILWEFYKRELALTNNAIIDFNVGNTDTDSFKIKEKITGQTGKNGTKKFEIWYH